MPVRAGQHGSLGSETVTHGFRVTVRPSHVPERSDPAKPEHVFLYRIRVGNESAAPARLLSRRWQIVDAHAREHEVQGDGVVGQQPRIEPGESFEYESWCPLRTTWGTMEGEYTMQRDDGSRFHIRIARFYLAADAPR